MSDKRKKKQARRAARRDAKGKKRPPVGAVRDAQGRTHLVVHRDAQGRPERLGLSRALFENGWQNDVALAAAHTAQGIMNDGRTVASAAELARSAMAATSRLVEGVLSNAPTHALACRTGCAHCCHQAVGVSAPEVFAIYQHLAQTRTREQLDAVTQRLRAADDRTRGMTSVERLSPALPCPFLEQDRCSVYEVRPLACRGKNSIDAAACEQTLHDPEARADLVAGRRSVPCYLEPIRAFHAVAAGLQLALHELHGLSMAPLELTAALRVLFDEPEQVTNLWLAGEDPFAVARGGDNTDDPRIRHLSGRK